MISVTWILFIAISRQLRGRNGIDILIGIKVTAVIGTALPLPDIVCVSTKLTIADEVSAAAAFEVELTSPFVENLVN